MKDAKWNLLTLFFTYLYKSKYNIMFRLISLLIYLLLFIPMIGQENLYFLGATTGAACQQVEFYQGQEEDFLFTGTGTTFRVYSLSSEQPPYELIFEYRFRSFITDIQLHNGELYIAANHDGVSGWDITNPQDPQMKWLYEPLTPDEASHDLSFYGDTLLIASNKMVVMLQITGSSYERTGEFGNISGLGFISGGDVKGNLYAYTAGRTINSDGVYLINLQTLGQVSYFPQSFCDPENVVFGQNTAFLHVLGGTQNYTNPLDSRGLFYTLDISSPGSPQLIFTDTINGFPGLAIANARIGINLNDTIYVVTTAGLGHNWVFPDPAYGQIYVYDARGPQVNYITELYAGLWYFDLDISKPKIYVASEWYGVKTIDITDLFDEQDLGNTLTGGWAMKADVYGNTLALANEGYGFKIYDISDVISPELITVNDEPGFCQDVKFSSDGSFIYAVYQTYEPFRVYDAETMERLGDLTPGGAVTYGWCRMAVYGNRVFLDHLEGPQQRLKIIDVTQPSSPQLSAHLNTDVRDMEIDDQGRLFICNDDSVLVYDVSNSGLNLLAGKALPGIQNGLEMAAYKDTIFVYVSFKGLTRYILLNNGGNWSLEEDGNVVLTNGVPQALAADSLGIYVGYTQYGIFTRDKNTLEELSNYRTGLDYKGFTEVWPLTDLFCRNGYIFVTEYFGQTSILTADPLLNSLPTEQEQSSEQEPGIYPNPNNGRFVIEMPDNLTLNEKVVIRIYNLYGLQVRNKEMMISGSDPGSIQVITGLPSGIYLVRLISRKGNILATKKVIIVSD